MQKKLLLIITLISTAFFANAQDAKPQISAGVTLGAAVGKLSSSYPVASSVNVRYSHPINDQLRILATTGFSSYVSSDGYYTGYDTYNGSFSAGSLVTFWPTQIGVKAYLVNRLFVQADAGISVNLNEYWDDITKVAPLVSTSVGYTVPFGRSKWSLDLGLGYENRIDKSVGFSQIKLGALFNFDL